MLALCGAGLVRTHTAKPGEGSVVAPVIPGKQGWPGPHGRLRERRVSFTAFVSMSPQAPLRCNMGQVPLRNSPRGLTLNSSVETCTLCNPLGARCEAAHDATSLQGSCKTPENIPKIFQKTPLLCTIGDSAQRLHHRTPWGDKVPAPWPSWGGERGRVDSSGTCILSPLSANLPF